MLTGWQLFALYVAGVASNVTAILSLASFVVAVWVLIHYATMYQGRSEVPAVPRRLWVGMLMLWVVLVLIPNQKQLLIGYALTSDRVDTTVTEIVELLKCELEEDE